MSRHTTDVRMRSGNRWRRLLAGLGVGALLFATVGDRGIAAVTGGIDPLDVLSLQTRPNAIVVLDSSGSMGSTLTAGGAGPGDYKDAKMYLAKSVLKTFIQNNQVTVNFQFAKYRNPNLIRVAYKYIYTSTETGASSIRANFGNYRTGSFTNASGATEYIFESRVYRVNKEIKFANASGSIGQQLCYENNAITAPAWSAPAGDWRDAPPYIDVVYRNNDSCGTSGTKARFYFRGVSYSDVGGSTCDGFDPLTGLASCTDTTEFTRIAPYLDAEVTPTATDLADPLDTVAVKTAGFTPIAESLIDIKSYFDSTIWPGLSGQTPKPRTFVIFVTDGDDSCPGPSSADSGSGNVNARALRAAYMAQLLRGGNGTDPATEVPVFVIAFGSGASRDRANWVAWGGSGMTRTTSYDGYFSSSNNNRWSSAPASKAGCATCVDAFVAATAAELSTALQAAVDLGQSSGTFSDQQSVTESIYEYVNVADPTYDPLDPETRYSASIPVLLQTTFDMPLFDGHLNAFRNEAGVPLKLWDAGQKLFDHVVTNSMGSSRFTFSQLHGNATAATIGGSSALIKRRIYTTTRLGVSAFLDGADSAIVTSLTTPGFVPPSQTTLWPPEAAVDPVCDATSCPAGSLDNALGLNTTNYANIAALQTAFKACTAAASGGSLPTACSRYDYALREARRILLAFAAGATLETEGDLAVRDSSGSLLYRASPWQLADSTLSAPGILAPPLEANPKSHLGEYQTYRDGVRNVSGISIDGYAYGFGLRNPDKDGTTGSAADNNLKPSMTVVLHPTNSMLHAIRGGPCPSGTCSDTGGEELWAFVPHDGLKKLRLRMQPQTRDNHTYMLAAPVRFADVFVPGNFNRTIGGESVSGNGVWRTVVLFGRGIGGKYLTALDVTTPGRLTEGSLSGPAPIHLWTRGNPDTQNGTTGGTKNNRSSSQAATYDFNAYALMGETWSVPTVSFLPAAQNETRRKSSGVEFVAFVGSGFSAISTEGSTFYALDALTGDVIGGTANGVDGFYNVGDRSGQSFENAFVANPAAFSPNQLRSGFVGHPASSETTYVYAGDIHGRLWRFITAASRLNATLFADVGANQPFGSPPALLFYKGTESVEKPHIFIESGNDRRVAAPPAATPPFRMYGFRDDNLSSDPDPSDGVAGPAKVLFKIDFPSNFRGTAQPATAYDANDPPNGRVFFVGTRFNPPGAPSPFQAPTPPPCVSSFDSILFAVGAATGGAAYDFGSGSYYQISGQRVQAVRVAGGQLVLDTGLGAQNPPPPPAPPAVLPPVPSPVSNVRFGSAQTNNNGLPIPGTMPYLMGSSTCH